MLWLKSNHICERCSSFICLTFLFIRSHLLGVLYTHRSPTVPEPARGRGSQKTLNDDYYHTTSRSAAIFGVHGGLPYLVLVLNLWIGICPTERRRGVWNLGEVLVTYRRSFGNHTLVGALCSGNILPETALVSQQFRCFTVHNLIMFQYLAVHFNWYIVWHILTSMSLCE